MTVLSKQVEVFNSGAEYLTDVPIRRALNLVHFHHKAIVIDSDPTRTLHGFEVPLAIALKRYIYPKWTDVTVFTGAVSRRGVLRRDNYTCGYCGRSATTIDHVLPRAQGGTTTWLNCVAACRECNFYKRDRTPEQANMTLWTVPYDPTITEDAYVAV